MGYEIKSRMSERAVQMYAYNRSMWQSVFVLAWFPWNWVESL